MKCNATVNSTTPSPAPKCPPVLETSSIINFLTSSQTFDN